MRVRVVEVTPGIGRWCASVCDNWGYPIVSVFSNVSADHAEQSLTQRLYGLKRLSELAYRKLRDEHEICKRAGLCGKTCDVCATLRDLEAGMEDVT